jgi:hypothetical protein
VAITWTIDHHQRTLVAECDGVVTLRELENYLAAVVEAGTASYRKLFDSSRATTSMTEEEIVMLGVRIRACHGGSVMGPLALVVASDQPQGLDRVFGALAAADRPIRIFRAVRAARRWLDTQVN